MSTRCLLTANLPLATDDLYVVNPNTTLHGASVLLNDADADGDSISQAIIDRAPRHGQLSVATNGTFSYIPNTDYLGTDTFTYFAVDPLHNERSAEVAEVTIFIGTDNSTPFAVSAAYVMDVNSTLVDQLTAFDPNGNPLAFLRTPIQTAHGNVYLNTAGQFRYTPNFGYVGPDWFTYQVSDGQLLSAPATVSISVLNAGDHTPTADSQVLVTQLNQTVRGVVTGRDRDHDPLTFHATSTPIHGTLSLSRDGSFEYVPVTGFNGIDSFTFVADDGVAHSLESTVSITVGNGDNNPPEAQPNLVSMIANSTFHGKLFATDADHDPLTFLGGRVAPLHGTVIINSNGHFNYTPVTGFQGLDTFSFQVTDGQAVTVDVLETIHVGNLVNSRPVANTATINSSVDVAFHGSLTGFDSDGDRLFFEPGTTLPVNGAIALNSDGSFTYTPKPGFIGVDVFTFRVTDGATTSTPTLVTIQVLPSINVAPIVVTGSGTTNQETPLNGALSPLGIDATPRNRLVFTVVVKPRHGQLKLQRDGSFVYLPAAGFTGNDEFTFRAFDGLFASNTATFHLTVNPPTAFQLDTASKPGLPQTTHISSAVTDIPAPVIKYLPTANSKRATLKADLPAEADSRNQLYVVLESVADGYEIRGQKICRGKLLIARQSGGKGQTPLVLTFTAVATADDIASLAKQIIIRTNEVRLSG